MKFFDFVVKYWFIWIYYIAFTTTVFRFQRQVVTKTRWYQGVRYHLLGRWETEQHKRFGELVLLVLVLLPVMLLLFQVAPILWFVLGHLDAREQKRRDEEGKQRRECERVERERKDQENAQNAVKRGSSGSPRTNPSSTTTL